MRSLLFHCESLMDVKLISTTPVMKYLILKSVFLWHGLVYHSCMMMMLEAVSQKILLKISILNFSFNLATKAKLKSNLSHFWFTPRFDIWRWTQSSKEKSGGNVKIYLSRWIPIMPEMQRAIWSQPRLPSDPKMPIEEQEHQPPQKRFCDEPNYNFLWLNSDAPLDL